MRLCAAVPQIQPRSHAFGSPGPHPQRGTGAGVMTYRIALSDRAIGYGHPGLPRSYRCSRLDLSRHWPSLLPSPAGLTGGSIRFAEVLQR